MPGRGGSRLTPYGAEFSVHAPDATALHLCLFGPTGEAETSRITMRRDGGWWHAAVSGVRDGERYGFRAEGPYDPDRGLWFDPSKLLVDPFATELDRPFRHDVRLTVFGEDTADLVPRSILKVHPAVPVEPPRFAPGGLIYEVAVKPFTMLHPDIPAAERGTIKALAHPSVIAHLKRLKVSAVELMPVTAWIDERHLPALGLSNGWGYNPIALMALDPRLAPGGMADLRETVTVLHEAGIGVILDLVFNHTGESDRYGATLSLRGLDNHTAYRHVPGEPGTLINDTGCGNTLRTEHPVMQALVLESLRHFVQHAGVDGFRFDLATILFRTPGGFDAGCEMASAMLGDPVLGDRVLIAEPWDIGPGGYQLGRFPERFLEWNDQARDTLRRCWRGDWGMNGALATVLAGSSDVFPGNQARGVTFLAAHDGFCLMDLVSNEHKHNEANGEDNRDGHNENLSWNNGVEGDTDRADVLEARQHDVKALLGTLFATRGAIMLTAGDEGGRSQQGNNNAYAQDNPITWLDWAALSQDLISHTAFLSGLRQRFAVFSETTFLTGQGDVRWLHADGGDMQPWHWQDGGDSTLGMLLATRDHDTDTDAELAVLLNRGWDIRHFRLPGDDWQMLDPDGQADSATATLPPRSLRFLRRSAGQG